MTEPRRPLFRAGRAGQALSRIIRRVTPVYRKSYAPGQGDPAVDRARAEGERRLVEARSMSEAEVAARQAEVERGFWSKLRRVAQHIPFLEDLVAAYYAMTDSHVPLQARGALALALLYFLWIVDLVPDFLGPLGFTDDGAVLATVIAAVASSITGEHRAKARKALGFPSDAQG